MGTTAPPKRGNGWREKRMENGLIKAKRKYKKAMTRVRREVVIVIEVFENQWVIVSAIVPLVIERGR